MITKLLVLNGGDADWVFIVGKAYMGHKVIRINDFTHEINQYVIITDKGEIRVNAINVIVFAEHK